MPVPLLKLCPPAETLTPDADLLNRFAANRDEAAFAELVRRHGPVVYRVCRRLVPAHAEDAFQAVFLILACRVAAVRNPAAVGSWLIGVAGRVARQMGKKERHRAVCERNAGRDESMTPPSPDTGELAAVLDDELARLPETLRDPVVLCLVGGRTHAQAAADLGASTRTLRRRLDRARALLRARLERRGVVPTVAALVAGVSGTAGAVPPALLRHTTSVVFQFLDGGATATAAKGVMHGMVKLKVSALVATAAAVLVCLGVGWAQDQPPRVDPVAPGGQKTDVPPVAKVPTVPGVPDAPLPGDPGTVRPAGPPWSEVRGPNFVVRAPTPVMARVIAAEAEYHRRTLALKWLGKELPQWSKPCAIRFTPGLGGTAGASTFTFGKDGGGGPVMATAEMELRGDIMAVLTNTLPHEVAHTILASFHRKPLPRWADEGVALLSENDDEQARLDGRVRDLLGQGCGMRLKVLLRMTEYPRDVGALYAQGHSIVRFLSQRPKGVSLKINHAGEMFETGGDDGNRRLVAFLLLGGEKSAAPWDAAARTVYGFESVDALEEAWLAWLARPESVLPTKAGVAGSAPGAKAGGTDLIPPVKLPTHRRDHP